MTRPSLNRSRAASLAQIAALVAIALLGITLNRITPAAEPLRLEAQVGVCQQGKAEDGVWWTRLYPHQIDLRSECWQIGVSQAPWQTSGFYGTWKLGWRLAYVDLGQIKADTQFTYLEPQYRVRGNGENCNSATKRDCVGRGIISGRTRGFSLGGLAEHPAGDWTLGLEGGAYFYYSRFQVNVTSYPDASKITPLNMVWGDWLVSPYVGLTARYGYLFATGRVYTIVEAHKHNCRSCTGITDHGAWQATIGFQVPLR